jgi:hypothetical protein
VADHDVPDIGKENVPREGDERKEDEKSQVKAMYDEGEYFEGWQIISIGKREEED